MQKLYKYRPLNDFIFKELYYNEIYFASYPELNDPLDLNVMIDFKPTDERQIQSLIIFLVKNSLFLNFDNEISLFEREDNYKLIDFINNKDLTTKFSNSLYCNLLESSTDQDKVSFNIVENFIQALSNDFNIKFRIPELRNELQRLTKVFFENSYTSCFSETFSDFLMWSHYATKHSGICLEFSSEHEGKFPFISTGIRTSNKDKYLDKISEWENHGFLFWDKIRKIEYLDKLPSINFYDFFPVFANEHDCDLMGLSKSIWHGYAHELERVFSVKSPLWKYEKEWRAIEINFGKSKTPEDRIRHYPIEALTGIFFGIRTPEKVKERIFNIFKDKNAEVKYFEAHLTNERDLEFNVWEYNEE